MYNAHFQFREPPFGVTPDPQFYYPNPANPDVCAAICRGIVDREGVFLIVGEPGCGKTTLLRKILQDLGPGVQTAYLSQTLLDDTSILDLVLDDLRPRPAIDMPADPRERLQRFLIEEARQGKTIALLIDEAQNLSAACLDELRDLSGWDAGGARLLQIVLAGQPELATKLEQPVLLPLRQRIALRCALEPLSADQVALYIDTRLQAIDCRAADVFESDAVDAIARFSGGIPRMINHLCDHGLLCAYALSAAKVSAGIVREIAADLAIVEPDMEDPRPAAELPPAPSSPAPEAKPEAARLRQRKLFAVAVDHARHRYRLLCSRRWMMDRRFAAAILLGVLAGATIYFSRGNSPPVAQAPLEAAAASRTRAKTSASNKGSRQDSSSVAIRTGDRVDARAVAAPAEAPKAVDTAFSSHDIPRDPPVKLQEAAEENTAVGPDGPESKRALGPRVEPEPAPRPVSYTVVGRSFVRSTPTSNAEIIATLEPGAEINVTGKTGEYFRIRASGREPFAGFVHREDAFFEKKK